MYEVDTIERGEFTAYIVTDDLAGDPRREFDELCTMVCDHGSYKLGDMTLAELAPGREFSGFGDIERFVRDELDAVAFTWLGLLDHSGLHMYAGGGGHWSDPGSWDSGTVGFAYVSRDDVIRVYGADTPQTAKTAQNVMMAEIEIYDQYLRGEVYAYHVEDSAGVTVDSCGGFYGLDDVRDGVHDALEAAEVNAYELARAEFERAQPPLPNL